MRLSKMKSQHVDVSIRNPHDTTRKAEMCNCTLCLQSDSDVLQEVGRIATG